MTEPGALTVVAESTHELFDLADEEQIIAELQGRVTDKYVYTLKGVKGEDGKEVTGLSYAGTNWACREYAKRGEIIRIVQGSIEYQADPTNDEYVLITVIAQRFAVNKETGKEIALDTAPGLKRQWTKMKRTRWVNGQKDGHEIIDDQFFWEKGLSKATRNAKQALIPTDIVKELVAKALEQQQKGHSQARPADPQGRGSRPAPARGAAPPRGESTSNASPASAPPGAAGAPPQGGGQQASTPPAGGAAAPAPGSSAAPQAQKKDSLVQGFEIVLKAALKTQDGAVARAALKKICGTDKISDLSEADLRKYGKILQSVPGGDYRIAEDGTHVMTKSGEVVWGTKSQAPAAAAASGPASATPPAPDGQQQYF